MPPVPPEYAYIPPVPPVPPVTNDIVLVMMVFLVED